MRKYSPKDDKSKQNYYKDRFFVSKQTPKSEIAGSKFEEDLQNLRNLGVEILNSYIEFNTLVMSFVNND